MEKPDIPNTESKVLAAIIVTDRQLGIYGKDILREVMIELKKREAAGDDFDFSKYIKEKSAQAVDSNLDPNKKTMLATLMNIKIT